MTMFTNKLSGKNDAAKTTMYVGSTENVLTLNVE